MVAGVCIIIVDVCLVTSEVTISVHCDVGSFAECAGVSFCIFDGEVCGIKLPEGLKESDKLPEPIYTPSTKAEIGDHDENISFEQSVDYLEKRFPGKGQEYAEKRAENEQKYYEGLSDYGKHFYRKTRPTTLSLKKKMPLFIEYYTSFVGLDGQIQYREDIYYKDQNILNLMRR